MKPISALWAGLVTTGIYGTLFSITAFAQITWTGGGSDANWATAANWSTGSAPSGTSNVIIGANASTVTIASAAAANQLTFTTGASGPITLQMNSNFRIGTSLTVDAGTAYDTTISSAGRTLNIGNSSSNLTGNQTVTFANNSDHLLSFTGSTGSLTMGVTGTGGGTVTLAFAGNGSFLVNQKIDQAASANPSTFNLSKSGSGTLTLNSSSITYNGTTTINGGTVRINGTHTGGSTYAVNSGGTLGGGGEIVTAGNAGVTIASGGKLDAGTGEAAATLKMNLGTGTLDLSGAVSGDSNALLFSLGATSDRILLEASSTLTIGSGLLDFNDFAFTLESGFAPGSYTLFETSSADAILGSLGSTLQGTLGGYAATLSLETDGNGIETLMLTVVPEPLSLHYLTVGGLAFLLAGRRRNRSGSV